jgi:hypothetical protein
VRSGDFVCALAIPCERLIFRLCNPAARPAQPFGSAGATLRLARPTETAFETISARHFLTRRKFLMKMEKWQMIGKFARYCASTPKQFGAAVCAAMLLISPSVFAAPVMPTDPNHLWLLDELGAGYAGKASPDKFGGVNLYGSRNSGQVYTPGSGTYSPQLVGAGDNLPVLPKVVNSFTNLTMGDADDANVRLRSVPFKYTGNKSAVSDYGDPFSYPARISLTPSVPDLQAMPNGGLHINGSNNGGGAISFWVNPINHNPHGYQSFFDFRDVDWANVDPNSGVAIQNQIEANTTYRFRATADGFFGDGLAYFGARVKSYDHGNEDPFSFTMNPSGPNNPYGWGNGVHWGGASTPQSQPGGQWSNIVVTWGPDGLGGTTLTVYSNGTFLGDAPGAVVPDFYADALMIGAKVGGDNAFAGMFDEVAIWDTPLTADNVEWIYQNSLSELGVPIPEPTSGMLLAMGLLGMAAFRRRRHR